MGVAEKLRFYRVSQSRSSALVDWEQALSRALAAWQAPDDLRPGSRVAVTAGSRGIASIVPLLHHLIAFLRGHAWQPFLLASMGSHGGATREGQLAVLASLGLTAGAMGVPVVAATECVFLAALEPELEVYVNQEVLAADAVVVVNRIKPHTSFHGEIESGLLKMLAVGLGGPDGAEALHRPGPERLSERIVKAGEFLSRRLPVIFGLGLVEDENHCLATVQLALPQEFKKVDAELLRLARQKMAGIGFSELDVLIVKSMGKGYSGTGMDTNVIGRLGIDGLSDPPVPRIKRLVVLDLDEASHGNANGIGLADFTTRRLVSKIDWQATYKNVLTTGFLRRAMIPLVMADDTEAIAAAVASVRRPPDEQKIVLINNTLELDTFWISPVLVPEAIALGFQVTDGSIVPSFSTDGIITLV